MIVCKARQPKRLLMKDRKEELMLHGYRLVSEFPAPVNTPLLVVTPLYRCVGILHSSGVWRCWGSEKQIEEVLAWRPAEMFSQTIRQSLPPEKNLSHMHRIIIVEDHADLRFVLGENFRERGYAVEEAPNAEGLRCLFSGARPDVVLLDLQLPDGDGLALLSEIKQRWTKTEVIVLSGFGTLDLAVEATKRGAFHFQTKPHHEGLYLLVERALERKRHSCENVKLVEALKRVSGEAVFQSQP